MTVLKTDSLKLYKDKLENYISNSLEYSDESEVINVFSELHKYRFEILPSTTSQGYRLLCRLNVEQNNERLSFENIDYSKHTDTTAIINTKHGVCNVSISNSEIYPARGDEWEYSVAYPLRGNGQCLATGNDPYTITFDKIANLSSISFFPSWNGVGYRAEDFNAVGYSKSVNVKVYCDDEEIFNGKISGLVACDRVYVTFDKFNKCHLEKFNVGSAAAFANY